MQVQNDSPPGTYYLSNQEIKDKRWIQANGALQGNNEIQYSKTEENNSFVQVFSLYRTDSGCALP